MASETLRVKLSATGVRRLDAANGRTLTARTTASTGGRMVEKALILTATRPRAKKKK